VLDARLQWQHRRARRDAERREEQLRERDRRWIAELRGRRDLKINVGSSTSVVEGWINADIDRDPDGRCLRFDATRRWPFEDGSAIAVNSEHVIEHLDPEAVPGYLAEAHRVLAPGGVIRTSTPDLEGICRAYADGDQATLEGHRALNYTARNLGDLVNNYFHMHGHRHLYDLPTLQLLLADAGFEEVERAQFGASRHSPLAGVDRHEVGPLLHLVLIVDAVKPG
jgi:predicted SAM-dependent methyltransferase